MRGRVCAVLGSGRVTLTQGSCDATDNRRIYVEWVSLDATATPYETSKYRVAFLVAGDEIDFYAPIVLPGARWFVLPSFPCLPVPPTTSFVLSRHAECLLWSRVHAPDD